MGIFSYTSKTQTCHSNEESWTLGLLSWDLDWWCDVTSTYPMYFMIILFHSIYTNEDCCKEGKLVFSEKPYLSTPMPFVSSPLPIIDLSCDSTQICPLQTSTSTQALKDSSQHNISKHKFSTHAFYDACLADQAVNTISEIWCPQDIPWVFLAPKKGPSLINVTASNPSTPRDPEPTIINRKPLSPPTSLSTKPSPFPQPSKS